MRVSHQMGRSCGRSLKQQGSWASIGRRTSVCRARAGTPPLTAPSSPSSGPAPQGATEEGFKVSFKLVF